MMQFFRKTAAITRSFAVPEGERVYAIGDIHGCDALLEELIDRIERDSAARTDAAVSIVFLGDLVDRGPDSFGVVERVRRLCEGNSRVHLVLGNHEEVFLAAARGDPASVKSLLAIGGYATLESYGISRDDADRGSFDTLATLLLERIPREHVDFLATGRDWLQIGDYLFVHAGIRPGRPIGDQRLRDLRWIREPFLSATRNDGMMVVHGHTPVQTIDIREDRVGIDTGAFMSGTLSAIALQGSDRWYLQTGSPQVR